jgi:hypothetical protein
MEMKQRHVVSLAPCLATAPPPFQSTPPTGCRNQGTSHAIRKEQYYHVCACLPSWGANASQSMAGQGGVVSPEL